MEIDWTLSLDNPLWSVLSAAILLLGAYLANKKSGGHSAITLDTLLSILASSRIPLITSFVAFVATRPEVREKLQNIWNLFMGKPVPDDTKLPEEK